MGRGRAKAKQTKVARELKYSSRGTDLDALRAELTGAAQQRPAEVSDGEVEDDDDPYAAYDGTEVDGTDVDETGDDETDEEADDEDDADGTAGRARG